MEKDLFPVRIRWRKMAAAVGAVGSCLAIAACAAATVASSGVQRSGQDSYTVYVAMKGHVASGEDNRARTRARALSDANGFCSRQGLGLAYVLQEQLIKDETAGIVINFSCGG